MKRDRENMRGKGENQDRGPSRENSRKRSKTTQDSRFTEVKNAHASGLGSMGRSDEKLKDWNRSPGPDEVVY